MEGAKGGKLDWTMEEIIAQRFSGHPQLGHAWEWARTHEPMSSDMAAMLLADANSLGASLFEAIIASFDVLVAQDRLGAWAQAAAIARDGGAVLRAGPLKNSERVLGSVIHKLLGRRSAEASGLAWRKHGAQALKSSFKLVRMMSDGRGGPEADQDVLDKGLCVAAGNAIFAPGCENVAKARAWLMMGANPRAVGFGRQCMREALEKPSAWWLASCLAEFGAPAGDCSMLAAIRSVEAFRRGGWRIGDERARELVSAALALFDAAGEDALNFRSKKGRSIGGLIIAEVEAQGLPVVAKALGELGGAMIGAAAWSDESLRVAYEQGALAAVANAPIAARGAVLRI